MPKPPSVLLPAATFGLALAGVLLLAGCSGGGGQGTDATRTAVPTATADSTSTTGIQSSAKDATGAATPGTETVSPKKTMVIAWQPSHQADTAEDWDREYVICGDIVDRVMVKLAEYPSVKAWEIHQGKTGSNNYRPKPSNTKAFDSELKIANEADADIFVGIHNDSGAPKNWLLGEVLPGDKQGTKLCSTLLAALHDELGWKASPPRPAPLYSLEPVRNKAKYRCLLEIGDNVNDRAFLEKPENRDRIATALANGIREFDANR